MIKISIEQIAIALFAVVTIAIIWSPNARSQALLPELPTPMPSLTWHDTIKAVSYKEEDETIFCVFDPSGGYALGKCWKYEDILTNIENDEFEPATHIPAKHSLGDAFQLVESIRPVYIPVVGNSGAYYFCGVESNSSRGKCWNMFDIWLANRNNDEPKLVGEIYEYQLYEKHDTI